jgi:hypothetical protein
MKRHLIPVEAVKYDDLILSASAEDVNHVYVERVNSSYVDEHDGQVWTIVITDMGYSRYTCGQIVTVLRKGSI